MPMIQVNVPNFIGNQAAESIKKQLLNELCFYLQIPPGNITINFVTVFEKHGHYLVTYHTRHSVGMFKRLLCWMVGNSHTKKADRLAEVVGSVVYNKTQLPIECVCYISTHTIGLWLSPKV